MAAYLLAFKARTAVLVYPTGEGEPRTLLRSDLVPGGATVLAVELPMAGGHQASEEYLSRLLTIHTSSGAAYVGGMHEVFPQLFPRA